MMHFGGGPLQGISIQALTSGIIFTVFLILPAYRSLSKACWQHGIRGLFSPKPLTEHWGKALKELDSAFRQAQATDRFSSSDSSLGGDAQEMFRQGLVCSVAGYEGEFDDVGAVGEGAVRGGRPDLAYGHVGYQGDAEAGGGHGQLGEDRVGEVADGGAESGPAAGGHELVVVVR